MNYLDILQLDKQLTSEELLIKNTAKQYAQESLMPRILLSIEMKDLIEIFIMSLESLVCLEQP